MSEIRLRAVIRIGEISRSLEKAEANGRGEVSLPTSGKRKEEQLEAAGLKASARNFFPPVGRSRQGRGFISYPLIFKVG